MILVFLGKIHLMLKNPSRLSDRDVYIITKLPPEQDSIPKIKIKEIGEQFKPLNEYGNAIIVFDDVSALQIANMYFNFF